MKYQASKRILPQEGEYYQVIRPLDDRVPNLFPGDYFFIVSVAMSGGDVVIRKMHVAPGSERGLVDAPGAELLELWLEADFADTQFCDAIRAVPFPAYVRPYCSREQTEEHLAFLAGKRKYNRTRLRGAGNNAWVGTRNFLSEAGPASMEAATNVLQGIAAAFTLVILAGVALLHLAGIVPLGYFIRGLFIYPKFRVGFNDRLALDLRAYNINPAHATELWFSDNKNN